VKFFSSLGPPVNPIPKELAHPPVVKGAKGDFVWLIFEHQDKDPRDPAKKYYYNSFETPRAERKNTGALGFVKEDAWIGCLCPIDCYTSIQMERRYALKGTRSECGTSDRGTQGYASVRAP
jgi:hypothetical protein